MLTMKTQIGVVVRVRPFLENETRQHMKMSKISLFPNESKIKIDNDELKTTKTYSFDRIFDGETTQENVYRETHVDKLINKVVEGYNATVFAYGLTGSGKTYTMEGYRYENSQKDIPQPRFNCSSKDLGIIPRAINALFENIGIQSATNARIYTVNVSYIQIYNEKIFDLLNPSTNGKLNLNAPGLRLRWNPKEQFSVENLYVYECKNAHEAMEHFQSGIANKIMASHRMNLASSRSHSILTFKVESIDPKNGGTTVNSRLDLVDLAGSERTALTGNESAISQKESIEINKSLFTLRQVITILAESQKGDKKERNHIPYRESKLTSLLKQSIGGNCFCLMVACLSPADNYFEENVSTLNYATKAAFISNEPIKNEDQKTKIITDLKSQLLNMSKELNKANKHISLLTKLVNEGRNSNNPSEKNDESELDQGRITPISNFSSNPFLKSNQNSYIEKNSSKNFQLDQTLNSSQMKGSDNLYSRLIESIDTVRELLKSNKELRDKMESLITTNESQYGEIIQLQSENQDLRDKLAIYEQAINSSTDLRRKKPYDDGIEIGLSNKTSTSQSNILQELVLVKNQKKKLENRVKNLEAENTELQLKVNPKTFHLKEPKRSIMEIPKNLYEYNQAIFLRSKLGLNTDAENDSPKDAENDPFLTENVNEKRATSVTPMRNHINKLPSVIPRSITPIRNIEQEYSIHNLSVEGGYKIGHGRHNIKKTNQSMSNTSMVENPHYLKDNPVSLLFKPAGPNKNPNINASKTKNSEQSNSQKEKSISRYIQSSNSTPMNQNQENFIFQDN